MIKKPAIFLAIITFLGLLLRLFAVNWDYGFHLHPDERAIILYTLPLQFPSSLQIFFSPHSLWNPHFFAYGSFPLYLLKIIGSAVSYFHIVYAEYDYLTIIGRIISACFDTATIICIYFLAKRIFKNTVIALIAALFYTLCVLAIQLSHFYAVDTLLTFFTTFFLYKLLIFYKSPGIKKALSIGIVFGFALATKISSIVLLVPFIIALSFDFIFYFLQQPYKPKHWLPHLLQPFIIYGFIFFTSTLFTFFILEPYAFIDFSSFYQQSLQQAEMTKSAFTFPYTLQYVGKIPYLYEIKNIILWGMGPVLGMLAWIGFLYFILSSFRNKPRQDKIIIVSFFITYFALVGSFAIGFMRYMLPLYPVLCIFAAYIFYDSFNYLHKKRAMVTRIGFVFLLGLLVLWPLSFLSIYTQEPTRVSATKWILENIPKGKTIAIEHWDDALPLHGQEKYHMITMELYQPDTKEKWQNITMQLANSDYIVLASNRLYTPLQKLTDCSILPVFYCYKQTAEYYGSLFNGKLGFKKIAEFAVYPTIPYLGLPINDQSADESFTVYDHPTVIIFKKD